MSGAPFDTNAFSALALSNNPGGVPSDRGCHHRSLERFRSDVTARAVLMCNLS
jgi:hypothetical protein